MADLMPSTSCCTGSGEGGASPAGECRPRCCERQCSCSVHRTVCTSVCQNSGASSPLCFHVLCHAGLGCISVCWAESRAGQGSICSHHAMHHQLSCAASHFWPVLHTDLYPDWYCVVALLHGNLHAYRAKLTRLTAGYETYCGGAATSGYSGFSCRASSG